MLLSNFDNYLINFISFKDNKFDGVWEKVFLAYRFIAKASIVSAIQLAVNKTEE